MKHPALFLKGKSETKVVVGVSSVERGFELSSPIFGGLSQALWTGPFFQWRYESIHYGITLQDIL